MPFIPDINIADYDYDLPRRRIAQYPAESRDSSKLLIYREGVLEESCFSNLPGYLPPDSLLVFNETRVFPARLLFQKDSGAVVEIFCLKPVWPSAEINLAFGQKEKCTWECLVGNARRWKSGGLSRKFLHEGRTCEVRASRKSVAGNPCLVEISWTPGDLMFSDIIFAAGNVPLPPYIVRKDEALDRSRYQTVFARENGSVAAPTAGLHFTPGILDSLSQKNIRQLRITLHIGTGTFKPVDTSVAGHEMHEERISLHRDLVGDLLHHTGKIIIATGTTTVRTLESLYWFGVRLLQASDGEAFKIAQWEPYGERTRRDVPAHDALGAVMRYMEEHDLDVLEGSTRLMIVPGYSFKMTDIMITNFHLPRSTLLLLVSAFIGDAWKEAYRFALARDFRFLSYGDACLLFRECSSNL
jgi:S-adenosylmethionine:tRNA ribosyltransferase-isomerase